MTYDLKNAIRNRRTAAIREANHVVIARHLGRRVNLSFIYPHDDLKEEWLGEVSHTNPLVAGVPSHLQARQERMIGVAGAVAELSWARAYNNVHELFYDCEWEEIMSPTDWFSTGCDPGSDDAPLQTAIKKVGRLLHHRDGPLWSELVLVARALIVKSRRHPLMNPVRIPNERKRF